jgi:pimeloyl-ACP methyl ester carboxylesterase
VAGVPRGRDPRQRLLAALPITERRLQLTGVSSAVLEGGDGPPELLLHGPGEFAAVWARVIPGLTTTHRVIAPNLPGHGASGLPDGRLDGDRVLAWLGDLIERTCASPPALVGHLLGGAIAARFASERRDLLGRLVLVVSFGLSWNRPSPRFALALLAYLARPTERTRDRFLEQCFVDFDGLRGQMGERFEPFGAYALEWARTKTGKAALRSLMTQFGVRPIPRDTLARIAVPTTLVATHDDVDDLGRRGRSHSEAAVGLVLPVAAGAAAAHRPGVARGGDGGVCARRTKDRIPVDGSKLACR